MQNDHEAYKAEAAKRSAASQEECAQLRTRAEAASSEVAALQEKVQQLQQGSTDASATQAAVEAKSKVENLTQSPSLVLLRPFLAYAGSYVCTKTISSSQKRV